MIMERTAKNLADALEEKLALASLKKRVTFVANDETEAKAVAAELAHRGHRASADTGVNLFKGTAHHCVVIEPPKKARR